MFYTVKNISLLKPLMNAEAVYKVYDAHYELFYSSMH